MVCSFHWISRRLNPNTSQSLLLLFQFEKRRGQAVFFSGLFSFRTEAITKNFGLHLGFTKICIKYRKHWKSCMGFQLPGQTYLVVFGSAEKNIGGPLPQNYFLICMRFILQQCFRKQTVQILMHNSNCFWLFHQ